jgi:soluble lytic murein transglycosylase-like protein
MTQQEISNLIVSTATAYGVDPRLALEVAMKESSLNPNVPDSSAGAIGIFQLEPATAADLGVDPRDAAQNIDGGIRYLSQLISKYAGNLAEALAAYNWGMGNLDAAIAAHGAGWVNYAPIETQDYVQTILGNVQSQYSFSVGTPAPTPAAGSAADSTTASEAGFLPTGFSNSGIWWIIGLGFAGWLLFDLLQ